MTQFISSHPLYTTWEAMKDRCYNEKCLAYKDYGGRGIDVCEKWKNSAKNFIEDMGTRPEGMFLERIDNDKGYSPRNCEWVSRSENARNRRDTVLLTIGGARMPLIMWAERFGINHRTIRYRMNIGGWDAERAVTEPARAKRSNRPAIS